jgi:PAS domain S-box-containing protein
MLFSKPSRLKSILAAAERPRVQRRLFWFAAFVIIASGLRAGMVFSYMRTQAIASSERLTASLAQVIAEQTTRTFQSIDLRLQLAAANLRHLETDGKLTPHSAGDLLRAEMKDLPFVRALSVADAKGRVLYSTDPASVGADVTDRVYFQIYRTAPETEFFIGPPRARKERRGVVDQRGPALALDSRRFRRDHRRGGRAPLLRSAVAMAQRLSMATSAASIGVWDWDLVTDQWAATPTCFTMLGYEPEESPGQRQRWTDRLHEEDRDRVDAIVQGAFSGADVPYNHEVRIRHADGSFRWVSVIGRVLERNADGKPARLLGVMMDITESKRVEEALRGSLRRRKRCSKRFITGSRTTSRSSPAS